MARPEQPSGLCSYRAWNSGFPRGPTPASSLPRVLSDDRNYSVSMVKTWCHTATFGTSSHLGLIDTAFVRSALSRVDSCDLSLLPHVFVTAENGAARLLATVCRVGPVISGTVLDKRDRTGLTVATGHQPIVILAFYGASRQLRQLQRGLMEKVIFAAAPGSRPRTFYAYTIILSARWTFR